MIPTCLPQIIAPSILSADFANLGQEVRDVVTAGADWIHLDVMDGHFVPNLSFGSPVISSLQQHTNKPFDVHLMVDNPQRLLKNYVDAGAYNITVHAEACDDLGAIVDEIHSFGCKAGVAINPETCESVLSNAPNADLFLVMGVNPGKSGQKMVSGTAEKVARIRAMLGSKATNIEVDGGVNLSNIKELSAAGANVLVAASAIFGGGSGADHYSNNISALRAAANFPPVPSKTVT